MEFVGMHLGRVIAEYLEKLAKADGFLSPEAARKIEEIESAEEDVGSIIEEAAD